MYAVVWQVCIDSVHKKNYLNFFESGSTVAQANTELSIQLRMNDIDDVQSVGITGMLPPFVVFISCFMHVMQELCQLNYILSPSNSVSYFIFLCVQMVFTACVSCHAHRDQKTMLQHLDLELQVVMRCHQMLVIKLRLPDAAAGTLNC